MKSLEEKVAARKDWRDRQKDASNPKIETRGRPTQSIFGTVAKVERESSVEVLKPKRVKMTPEERKEYARRRQREYYKKLREKGISPYSLLSEKAKRNKYDTYIVRGGQGPKSRGLVRLDEAGAGFDNSPDNTLTDIYWQFGMVPYEGKGGFESLYWFMRECARIEEDYRGSDDIPLNAVERREVTGNTRILPVRSWTELALQINEHG